MGTKRGLAVLAAMLLLVTACGDDADDVSIAGAWARNSPTMAGRGAAYMTITSPIDDTVVGAEVPATIADHAELHESYMNEGAMAMREVEGYSLTANQAFELKPGSYHVMLIDLVAPLEVGQKFTVTLEFEKAGKRAIEVEVREDAP